MTATVTGPGPSDVIGPVLAGVDIGGTTVAVRLADASLRAIGRTDVPTVRDQPDGAGRQVVDAIGVACREAGIPLDAVAAVGIGTPGQVDIDAGTVANAVNLGWEAVPLAAQVAAILGVPCLLDNDVRVAAEGLREGRVLGEDVLEFVYLSVGTGIAAGVVVEGRLHRGAHALAGEVGHLVVDAGGPRCACGSWGCLESIASGPAVAAHARRAIAAGADSALREAEPFTARDVYEASAAGDPVAVDAVATASRALARAIHHLGVILDIPAVAIGGGVTAAGAAFREPLDRALDDLRAGSELAAAVLPHDLIKALPPGYEPGTWGAVQLARKGWASEGARAQPRKEVATRAISA